MCVCAYIKCVCALLCIYASQANGDRFYVKKISFSFTIFDSFSITQVTKQNKNENI
uniref:Secreted protein n=1 Tax=Anopheles funestus TaxID=62324 RepID=A0A182S3W9_ANOFN